MPRPATGTIVEKQTSRGTSFAMRFSAHRERQYELLGYSSEGWDRRRADDALADTLADVRRGLWLPPNRRQPDAPAPVPDFHAFSSEWLAGREAAGLRPRTLEYLRWALTDHLLAYFAEMPLDRIGVEDVDRFARAKVASGRLAPRSINHTVDVLAGVLETAVEYGHIDRNPAKGRRRRLPVPQATRSYLDRAEQITALLDAASGLDAKANTRKGQRRALLAALVFAGLRIGEAVDLTWGDVNLADGRLHVRASKTGAGVRAVHVLPVLRDELAVYRANVRDAPRDARVFGTTNGGRHSLSNIRQRILAKAVDDANAALAADDREPLPEHLTPHSLRRTFASILAALNEPMPSTIRQLGHTNPTLTLRIYAAAMDSGPGETERLRALVEGGSPDNDRTPGARTHPNRPESARNLQPALLASDETDPRL